MPGEVPVRGSVKQAVAHADPSGSTNLGLRFYKYVDVWSSSWALESGSKNEAGAKLQFLEKMIRLSDRLGAQGGEGLVLLHAARCRLDRLMASLSASGWTTNRQTLRSSWRMVTGLGISHPFETGFVFHHTLGVPFLPGSSVKGAAAAFARQKLDEQDPAWPTKVKEAAFGDNEHAGRVVFFDALPTIWPKLEIDIMNPHYAEYYNGSKPPADWLSPTPIHFLAIAAGQPFEFAVAVKPERKADETNASELLSLATRAVQGAATEGGLGGKSAVGYGYFV